MEIPRMAKYEAKTTRCYTCMDSGVVTYQKEYQGRTYTTALRCICLFGQALNSSIASVSTLFDPNKLAKENIARLRKSVVNDSEQIEIDGFIQVDLEVG